MRIVRYNNEQVQKELGSKIKPEPWLHVAIADGTDGQSANYAIYIWDTRQMCK